MDTLHKKPLVVLLMGPTASGKTAFSLDLAEALQTEIISVDSALVYREMDIGTAKPTQAETARIPHHLIDIIDPSETYSTGQFRDQASLCINNLIDRNKTPILTGGTMLYFNSLTQGLAQLPPANAAIRAELEQQMHSQGKLAMHEMLKQIDPDAAARIHMNDPQRIQRALEVYRITGQPLSSFFNQAYESPYRFLKIIISPVDRRVLHQRIEKRFHAMLKHGLIEEVSSLRSRGDMNLTMPSMRSVGYRQVWQYLEGATQLSDMIEQSIAASRQLAKRQLTWLRKIEDALWIDNADNQLPIVLERIQGLL